ncbi:MAG: hypothetical protein A2X94_15780 [Bdellovibrionales bacterium GWB1_55_8]|nr:MAG: hypothetical protein A2X94_15780 [Bdellovibrionales bacterium GWB1_55_8]
MSIKPTDPKELIPITPKPANSPKRHAARSDDPLADSRRQLRDAEVELSSRYEHMREQYEERSVTQSAKQQAALENQRSKGYEALRDLKRAQDIELSRIKADGEKRKQEVQQQNRTSIMEAERSGTMKLKDIQNTNMSMSHHEQKKGEMALSEMKAVNAERLENQHQDRNQKLEQAAQAYRKEYERMSATTNEAVRSSETRFNERYQNTVDSHDQIVERINSKASESLNQLREQNSGKLAAYETRAEDPFYQIVELGSELEDAGDAFVLRVTVPEYEQENMKVSLRGNDTLVLSGYRRNEDKLELEDGRTKRTAAFQSFSESMPLPAPVDAKGLTREYDDGELVIRVPKLGAFATKKIYQAAHKPERVRAERPDFPKNLISESPVPTKGRGDRTLG